MLRYAAALLVVVGVAPAARAMEAPCGLRSMIETTATSYLPLARAAQIEGVVILMAEFGTDGAITKLNVLSGPEMLQSGAVDFVKGWRANPYTGPRTCPLVITYVLGTEQRTLGRRIDPQHYIVTGASPPCLCDPAPVLGHRRKRFLNF